MIRNGLKYLEKVTKELKNRTDKIINIMLMPQIYMTSMTIKIYFI
jgi:hypothetical protein